MIRLKKNSLSIVIKGLYDEETVEILTFQLLDALQIASSAPDKGGNYYYLFLLLESILVNNNHKMEKKANKKIKRRVK